MPITPSDCASSRNEYGACYGKVGTPQIMSVLPKINEEPGQLGLTEFDKITPPAYPGLPAKYSRRENSANPVKCCFNEYDGGKTCDSKYTAGSNECLNTIAKHCQDPKNMGSLRCVTFYSGETVPQKTAMKLYCNTADGIKTSFCQKRCRLEGGCDTAAKLYCADPANKKNPFCACIASSDTRPECYDGQCVANGYLTDSMRQGTDCPNLLTCRTTLSIYGDQNTVSANQIQQTCANMNGDVAKAGDALGIKVSTDSMTSTFAGPNERFKSVGFKSDRFKSDRFKSTEIQKNQTETKVPNFIQAIISIILTIVNMFYSFIKIVFDKFSPDTEKPTHSTLGVLQPR